MVVIEVNNHRTGTSILLALIEVISVASSLTFECPNEKHWVRKNMKECWIGIQRERERKRSAKSKRIHEAQGTYKFGSGARFIRSDLDASLCFSHPMFSILP